MPDTTMTVQTHAQTAHQMLTGPRLALGWELALTPSSDPMVTVLFGENERDEVGSVKSPSGIHGAAGRESKLL